MKLVFFTGAGISVAAGLPTYRGPDGKYNPESNNFVPPVIIDHNTTSEQFKKMIEPYTDLAKEFENIEPTYCHDFIASLEQHHDVTVVTQNIDGLHSVAGSTNVIQLHGNIQNTRYSEHFECHRPDVVFFGEQLNLDVIDSAFDAVEQADVFISIGTSMSVSPANWVGEIVNHPNNFHIKSYHIDPLDTEIYIRKDHHFKTTADIGIDLLVGSGKLIEND